MSKKLINVDYPKIDRRSFIKEQLRNPFIPLYERITPEQKAQISRMFTEPFDAKTEKSLKTLTEYLEKCIKRFVPKSVMSSYRLYPEAFVKSGALTYNPLDTTTPPVHFKPDIPNIFTQEDVDRLFLKLKPAQRKQLQRCIVRYLSHASSSLSAQRYAVNLCASFETWHDFLLKNTQWYANYFYCKVIRRDFDDAANNEQPKQRQE